MALPPISNTALARSQVSQQNTGKISKQEESTGESLSSENGFSEGQFDDSVTLRQSQKALDISKPLDLQAVKTVLPRTASAILQHSSTAVSTQANISAQAAQKIMTDS